MHEIGKFRVTAYDAETSEEVFSYHDVVDTARPWSGDTLSHNGQHLQVVGVREASNLDLWLIEVRK
jgi:hypothetical protein